MAIMVTRIIIITNDENNNENVNSKIDTRRGEKHIKILICKNTHWYLCILVSIANIDNFKIINGFS